MISSSSSIALSAYKTQWFKSSVNIQRMVLLIIARAHKAQTVTAWKFFDVNLETFQWVIENFCCKKNIYKVLTISDHFHFIFLFLYFARNVWILKSYLL